MYKEYFTGCPFSHFVFSNTRFAPVWLIIRLYIGWTWLGAGWGKVINPLWFGASAGKPIVGFATGALQKTAGEHPDVQWWYASFLENVVLPHPLFWANLIACGELLVGIALLAGFLTGISAFFGTFMSFNFLLAGTVSINPILILGGFLLMISWKISGHIGLDRYVLPWLDRYCSSGKVSPSQT